MIKKELYCENCYHVKDPITAPPCNDCDGGSNFDRDKNSDSLQSHLYGDWEPENKIDIPQIDLETLKDNFKWSKGFSVIGVPAKHYQDLLKIAISYLSKERFVGYIKDMNNIDNGTNETGEE